MAYRRTLWLVACSSMVASVAWAQSSPESKPAASPAAQSGAVPDGQPPGKQARRAAHPGVEKVRALREQVDVQERLLREQMRGADAKTRKALREQMDAAREQVHAARQEMTKIRRETLDHVEAAVEEVRDDWRATHGELMDAMRNQVKRVEETVVARYERIERARKRAWDKTRRVFESASEIPAALTQELQMHGQRTARLLRIRAVAEHKGDRASVTRVDGLIEREEKRHHAMIDRVMRPHRIAQRRAAAAAAPASPVVAPAAPSASPPADQADDADDEATP